MLSRRAVESMDGCYRNARVEHRHLSPAQAGLARIGHFGFFAPESRNPLWGDSLAWLRRTLAASGV